MGGFKVGPRLIIKYGRSLTQALAKMGTVFIDNKYFDIPNTMESAIRASFDAGATYTTIHASCGQEALERLAKVEKQLNSQRPFKILAVTVLTSFADGQLPVNWKNLSISEHVLKMADAAISAGLSGLVCSGHEAKILRKKYPQSFLVTPGVRLEPVEGDDQKRVLTPQEAIAQGASALVIGRPIVAASDPAAAARQYLNSLSM